MSKRYIRLLQWIVIPILLITLSAYFKTQNIPNMMFLRDGEKISSDYLINISENSDSATAITMNNKIGDRKLDVKVLGLIPIKSVTVRTVPNKISVYPGGQPIGVKINTKGVLVVALSDVESMDGKIGSPAANSGIEIGDSIVEINGSEINNISDTVNWINNSRGNNIELKIDRKGTTLTKDIVPVKSKNDNKYKIGLWIRESTAGVGTLTFYDEKSNEFAGLGHPITDVDTGTILSINSGEIITSSIMSVQKGIKGSPGELKGIFVDENRKLGDINKNTECGIFGKAQQKLCNKKYNKPMNIALRSEIKEGPAKILTTVEGSEPEEYDILIEKLLVQDTPGPKSMVIKIIDQKLLEKTGGIVQGMSGSPIIQNNRLVGAVTHVLINKPDTGYGIYIEWMLKDADILNK